LQDHATKPGKGSCQQVLKGDMSQVHIQAPLLLNCTEECGGPRAIYLIKALKIKLIINFLYNYIIKDFIFLIFYIISFICLVKKNKIIINK